MDKDLFKSAILKCKQAAEDALGTEHWTDDDVTYSSFVKECFSKKRNPKKIWQTLKKVSEVVTEEEFSQLLRWPSFCRGWNFVQRFLFEDKYGLNNVVHAAMEEKRYRLPTDQPYGCGMRAFVEVSRLSKNFRLVEVRICPLMNEPEGCFLLELTNRVCVVLYLDSSASGHCSSTVRYDALSPWMLKRLEVATKRVREAVTLRYFPVYTCRSIGEWYRNQQAESGVMTAKRFLRRTCELENLSSRRTWNAFKKAFGIGDVLQLLDCNHEASGSMQWRGLRYRWSKGADFRIIWLEIPYDIEIPMFKRNGALWILQTVPDVNNV